MRNQKTPKRKNSGKMHTTNLIKFLTTNAFLLYLIVLLFDSRVRIYDAMWSHQYDLVSVTNISIMLLAIVIVNTIHYVKQKKERDLYD